MNHTTCPRCLKKFYTAVEGDIGCPYCGYFVQYTDTGLVNREENRTVVQRECEILKGEMTFSAQAVNISPKGVCIAMPGAISFEKEDALHVVINDLGINANARVVWFKGFDNIVSRAGLRFC